MSQVKAGRRRSAVALVAALALVLPLAGCGGLRGASEGGGATAPSVQREVADPTRMQYGSADGIAGAPADKGVVSSPVQSASGGYATPDAQRLVIRNKSLRLEVKKVSATVEALQSLAKKAGGYVAALQVATDNVPIYRPVDPAAQDSSGQVPLAGYITLRVPADKFDDVAVQAQKLGKVVWESQSSSDVTEQHVDMKARLENLRAEEAQLRAMFQRARNVRDMLQVEKELSRVRGDIESLDAQIKSLEQQAALATLTVEMVEPKPVVRPAGFDWGFNESITQGIRGFVYVIEGIIVIAMSTAPIWLFALALFFVVRWRWRKRHAAAPAEPVPDETA